MRHVKINEGLTLRAADPEFDEATDSWIVMDYPGIEAEKDSVETVEYDPEERQTAKNDALLLKHGIDAKAARAAAAAEMEKS